MPIRHPRPAPDRVARRLARALEAADGAAPRGGPPACDPGALAQLLGLRVLLGLLGGPRHAERADGTTP